MKLSELKTGEKGVIVKVLGHGGFRKRIVEMGFIKGKVVKVLLNERETRLPAGHVTGPYYSWKALKEYYGRKIAPYVTARNPMQ